MVPAGKVPVMLNATAVPAQTVVFGVAVIVTVGVVAVLTTTGRDVVTTLLHASFTVRYTVWFPDVGKLIV